MNLIDPAILGATLRDLLRTDNSRLIDESAYLRARLSDRAPQASREIALLVDGQSASVPRTLRANQATESLRQSIVSKLRQERGLSSEAANWVVDCWAAALDVTFVADPPKEPPPPDPDPKPKPKPKLQPSPWRTPRPSSSIPGAIFFLLIFWVRPWGAISYSKDEGFHRNQDWHLPWVNPTPKDDFPKIGPIAFPKIDPNNPALQPLDGKKDLPSNFNPFADAKLLDTPISQGNCWVTTGSDAADKCALTNVKGWDGQGTRIGTADLLDQKGWALDGDIYGTVGQEISVGGPSATCKPAGMWYGTIRLASGEFPDGVSMTPGGYISGQPRGAGETSVTVAMDDVKCNGVSYFGIEQKLNFHIAPGSLINPSQFAK